MSREIASIRSMLGLRFRDATTERPVTRGLHVQVRRADGTGRPTRALRTRSGAYVAQGLTGLRPYERVPQDRPDEIPESEKEGYYVDVRDPHGRFVPVVLKVRLPYSPKKKYNGLYPVVDPPSGDGADENGVPEPTGYLFGSVQRAVPGGRAVVYADLVEEGTGRPASHAVMKLRHEYPAPNANGNETEEEIWYGLADAEGRLAVHMPLPFTQIETLSSNGNGGNGPPSGSPPGRGRGRRRGGGATGSTPRQRMSSMLSERRWELDVSVRYQPSAVSVSSHAPRPLLRDILAQESGILYDTAGGTGTETLSATLSYGEPLILRTADRSELRVGPAGSS